MLLYPGDAPVEVINSEDDVIEAYRQCPSLPEDARTAQTLSF